MRSASGGRAQAGQQHRELVAAEPRDGVDLAQRRPQARTGLAQQLVAVVVAEGVVDVLEPVEVDEQQPRRRPRAPVRPQRLREAVGQQRAVRQAGQPVVQAVVQRPGALLQQQPSVPAGGVGEQARQREADDEDQRHQAAARPLAVLQRRQQRQRLLAPAPRRRLHPLLDVVEDRLGLLLVDALHLRRVAGVDGAEEPVDRQDVAEVLLQQRRGEGPVAGLPVAGDLAQRVDELRRGRVEPLLHPGAGLEAVLALQRLLAGDRPRRPRVVVGQRAGVDRARCGAARRRRHPHAEGAHGEQHDDQRRARPAGAAGQQAVGDGRGEGHTPASSAAAGHPLTRTDVRAGAQAAGGSSGSRASRADRCGCSG